MTPMSTSKKAAPPEPVRPERFLILLRHGIAEDATPEKKDEDRSLTSEGHARMKQIARGLERAFPKAQAVYSSPLLRAVQTSLWVSKAYRSRVNIATTAALEPGASAKDFLALVAGIEVRRAVIVGHEPTLTNGLFALTGIRESSALELKKGGCYGIRLTGEGKGVLEWILPPRVLRELGE